MELDSHTNPIQLVTHQSPNSQAAVRFEIQKAERIHWFLGLRQAELTIEDRRSALEFNLSERHRYQRKLMSKERKLNWLNLLEGITFGIFGLIAEIDELEQEILHARHNENKLSPYLRDCHMELATALKERQRILDAHPQALTEDFDTLQARYAEPAMESAQVHFLAARIWASQHGFSEAVGQAVFDLPDESRQAILSAAAIKMNAVESNQSYAAVQQALDYSARVLSSLPHEQQKIVLLRAAELITGQEASDNYPVEIQTEAHGD